MLVREQGGSMLVEWRDDAALLRRAVLPRNVAMRGVTDDDLAESIPYGIDFANTAAAKNFAARLMTELHESDIWTWQDYIDKPNEARAAFLRAGYQAMRQEAMR